MAATVEVLITTTDDASGNVMVRLCSFDRVARRCHDLHALAAYG